MSHLKIRKLSVFGPGKKTSIIEFGENLTIISGPSDTGKTYIFRCINYLFGAASKDLPFPIELGYDTLSGVFTSSVGEISVTRKLGSKQLVVNSQIDGIDSGEYLDTHPKDQSKTIGAVFFNMIGMRHDIKIPKKQDGEKAALTWRYIRDTFMIKEVDTERQETILYPLQFSDQTPFLSTLLYLLYKIDFTPYIKDSENEKNNAVNVAVSSYIEKHVELSRTRKAEIEKDLKTLREDFKEISFLKGNIENQLEDVNREIEINLKSIDSITNETLMISEVLKNMKMTLTNFKVLFSQYQADIKRLTFIVDGEEHAKRHSNLEKCPYCDGEMTDVDETSFIETAKIELAKTINNLNELDITMNNISSEIADHEQLLNNLDEEKNEITKKLNKVLSPKQTILKEQIDKYKKILSLEEELKVYEGFDDVFDVDLAFYKSNKTEKIVYRPKELFPRHFADEISTNFGMILEEMSFLPINSFSFNKSSFDIIVNGSEKKNYGKGFRALFNSTLILALRKYFNKRAQINPGFYVIDSPLHGLAMPENIDIEQSVRLGLFKYLYNNYGTDQIIIFENTDQHELPESDDENIKIIKFTSNEESGRYGFLHGNK